MFQINVTIRNSYAFTHIEAVSLVSCQLLAQLHKVTDSRLVSPAVLLVSYIKEVDFSSCLHASSPLVHLRGQTLAFYSNASVKPTVVFLSPPEDSLCTLHCICEDSLLHQWGQSLLFYHICEDSLFLFSMYYICEENLLSYYMWEQPLSSIESVRTAFAPPLHLWGQPLLLYYIWESSLCSPITSVRTASDPPLHMWGKPLLPHNICEDSLWSSITYVRTASAPP